jgi:hypothetical protein
MRRWRPTRQRAGRGPTSRVAGGRAAGASRGAGRRGPAARGAKGEGARGGEVRACWHVPRAMLAHWDSVVGPTPPTRAALRGAFLPPLQYFMAVWHALCVGGGCRWGGGERRGAWAARHATRDSGCVGRSPWAKPQIVYARPGGPGTDGREQPAGPAPHLTSAATGPSAEPARLQSSPCTMTSLGRTGAHELEHTRQQLLVFGGGAAVGAGLAAVEKQGSRRRRPHAFTRASTRCRVTCRATGPAGRQHAHSPCNPCTRCRAVPAQAPPRRGAAPPARAAPWRGATAALADLSGRCLTGRSSRGLTAQSTCPGRQRVGFLRVRAFAPRRSVILPAEPMILLAARQFALVAPGAAAFSSASRGWCVHACVPISWQRKHLMQAAAAARASWEASGSRLHTVEESVGTWRRARQSAWRGAQEQEQRSSCL